MGRKSNLDMAEKRKQQILMAAKDIFIQKGFEKATTAEIAAAAGVSEGTIYNYYRSKKDLIISLMQHFFITQQVIGIIQRPLKENKLAPLNDLIRERLNKVFSGVDLLQLFLNLMRDNQDLARDYLDRVLHPFLNSVFSFIQTGIRENALREFNAEVAERMFIGTVIGLSLINKIEGETGPLRKISESELTDEITRIFLNGIVKK
jgi:AcrR family transcriptional regulator